MEPVWVEWMRYVAVGLLVVYIVYGMWKDSR